MRCRLVKFRWVIPVRDQIVLKMKFISDEVGQIDQVCMVHSIYAVSMTTYIV